MSRASGSNPKSGEEGLTLFCSAETEFGELSWPHSHSNEQLCSWVSESSCTPLCPTFSDGSSGSTLTVGQASPGCEAHWAVFSRQQVPASPLSQQGHLTNESKSHVGVTRVPARGVLSWAARSADVLDPPCVSL